MFYSHEVLTSRKYGVATVWLVATLGSKSMLKKVSRKAILDVDVAKACATIGTPEAPLALRLQSNLLYGVTRVYAQQCGYVLNDAEAAKNSMRLLFNGVQANSLESEGANKARAEQLVLQDDPNFLPDFDLVSMNLDQLELNIPTEESQRVTLSPHNSQSAVQSVHSQDIGGLLIPESASSFVGGPVSGPVGGFDVFGASESSAGGARAGARAFLDDDFGLEIDQDGNLVMSDAPVRPSTVVRGTADQRHGGSVSSRHVMRDEQGQHTRDSAMVGQAEEDFNMPIQGDDPFASDGQRLPTNLPDPALQHVTSEETAEAPIQRRARPAVKPVPVDSTMELRSSDIARLNYNYVANMKEAIRQRDANKAAMIAKRNGQYWMMGTEELYPLSIFTGVKLLEALTGITLSVAGAKHPRDEDESVETGRRVRSRSGSSPHEIGRGEQDDGFLPMMGDDTIEQGREAPTPLDDRQPSGMMPWNLSTGSRRPTGLFGGAGHPTSTASIGGYPGPVARRGSRLTSASPLMGSADYDGSLSGVQAPVSQIDIDMTGHENFELFGPAAQVDTQTAGQSQWQRAVLDCESLHFLEFVQSGVEEMDQVREQTMAPENQDDIIPGTIDFETLLPPASHTCIVAAQGLLHVLALCTKSLLLVQQDDAYGTITVWAISAI